MNKWRHVPEITHVGVYACIFIGEVVYSGIKFLQAHRNPSGLWGLKRGEKKEMWDNRETLIKKIYRTMCCRNPKQCEREVSLGW